VKKLVADLDTSSRTVQEKENKLQCLKETKKKMKETIEQLSANNQKYQKLAEFVVNEYHPVAR
jgi:cell division protein FtsB